MRSVALSVLLLAACVTTPAAPSAGERCVYRVTVVAPEADGCFIDEKVSRSPGVAGFPCAGGPIEITYGSSVFRGTVTDGVVDASLSTDFDYDDGCAWRSTQRLKGALRPGAVLTYTYEEAPVRGEDCANPCRAVSVARVE